MKIIMVCTLVIIFELGVISCSPVRPYENTPVHWEVSQPFDTGEILTNELGTQQMIGNSSLAFLKQGALFIFDMKKGEAKQITETGLINSYSWSDKYHLFAIANKGRIDLIDENGRFKADIAKDLKGHYSHIVIRKCADASDVEIDPLQFVEGVDWIPDQNALLFHSPTLGGIFGFEICTVSFGILDRDTRTVREVFTGIQSTPYRFVDHNHLIAENYTGGGNYENIIAELSAPFRKSWIASDSSYPVESPNGSLWVLSQPPFHMLRVFSTLTQTVKATEAPAIFMLPLPFYSNSGGQSDEVWSLDSRYIALHQSDMKVTTEDFSFDSNRFSKLMIFDSKQAISSTVPYDFGFFRSIWVPNSHELLIIGSNKESLELYRVNALTFQVTPLQNLYPAQYVDKMIWSPTGRFLFFNSRSKGEQQWLYIWDDVTKKLSLIQSIPPSLDTVIFRSNYQHIFWSTNEQSLIIVQSKEKLLDKSKYLHIYTISKKE